LKHRSYANRDLIDNLIAGDREAAYVFYDKFGARISRWVWHLLGTDREHADIVQQVFVNIFESLPRIKKPDSFGAYVDSVTIKTTRFELRKRKARRALYATGESADLDESRDKKSPFKDQHIRHFYRILNTMPTDDRIIFILRYLEGHSIEEIASIGQYSTSTAKRRLKRAKLIFEKNVVSDFSLVSLVEECHAI
jgi:RNA polymerase sigma-70 factor, ECF subfamily